MLFVMQLRDLTAGKEILNQDCQYFMAVGVFPSSLGKAGLLYIVHVENNKIHSALYLPMYLKKETSDIDNTLSTNHLTLFAHTQCPAAVWN